MKVMKDMTRKIGSKGRMDAENRWWIADLLGSRLREGVAPSRRRKNTTSLSIFMEAFGLEVEEISLVWPPSVGQKGCGLENGQKNKKKLCTNRLLKSRREGKREVHQERSCARPVNGASGGHSGTP